MPFLFVSGNTSLTDRIDFTANMNLISTVMLILLMFILTMIIMVATFKKLKLQQMIF
jgi:hypothetical protein